MMPLGPKLAPHWGSQVRTYEQRRQTSKFFFSETGRPRAFIFGLWHLLVDLYQAYLYDAPGVRTGPALGVRNWNIETETHLQNSSSLKLEGVEL